MIRAIRYIGLDDREYPFCTSEDDEMTAFLIGASQDSLTESVGTKMFFCDVHENVDEKVLVYLGYSPIVNYGFAIKSSTDTLTIAEQKVAAMMFIDQITIQAGMHENGLRTAWINNMNMVIRSKFNCEWIPTAFEENRGQVGVPRRYN